MAKAEKRNTEYNKNMEDYNKRLVTFLIVLLGYNIINFLFSVIYFDTDSICKSFLIICLCVYFNDRLRDRLRDWLRTMSLTSQSLR